MAGRAFLLFLEVFQTRTHRMSANAHLPRRCWSHPLNNKDDVLGLFWANGKGFVPLFSLSNLGANRKHPCSFEALTIAETPLVWLSVAANLVLFHMIRGSCNQEKPVLTRSYPCTGCLSRLVYRQWYHVAVFLSMGNVAGRVYRFLQASSRPTWGSCVKRL